MTPPPTCIQTHLPEESHEELSYDYTFGTCKRNPLERQSVGPSGDPMCHWRAWMFACCEPKSNAHLLAGFPHDVRLAAVGGAQDAVVRVAGQVGARLQEAGHAVHEVRAPLQVGGRRAARHQVPVRAVAARDAAAAWDRVLGAALQGSCCEHIVGQVRDCLQGDIRQ